MIKRLLIIILILLPISIISFVVKYKTIFFDEQKEIPESNIVVFVKDKNLELDLEDYIIGVVAGEMPALFEKEALKAQAVAARSYALTRLKDNKVEITSTINDQVYLTKEEMKNKWEKDYDLYFNKIKNYVLETKNEVLYQNDKILKAYYFSMSNGFTEDSERVFGQTLLTSKESKWDNPEINNFVFEKEFTESEIVNLLNIKSDKINISNITRNQTNRVDKLEVNNIIFSGIEIRKLLSLRSTDFTITKQTDKYIITTKGYGHGVGMSQYGANGMAKEGYNYLEILKHYYDNVKIEKIKYK